MDETLRNSQAIAAAGLQPAAVERLWRAAHRLYIGRESGRSTSSSAGATATVSSVDYDSWNGLESLITFSSPIPVRVWVFGF